MNNSNNERADSLGVTEREVEGASGANLPGGAVTPPQDADAALDQSVAERIGDAKMEEAQQAGEVEQQRNHQTPTAGDPENGLPVHTLESESSGQMKNDLENSQAQKPETDDVKKNSDGNQSADELNSELSEAKNQLMQLAADFENFKRQAARREIETRERAVKSVIEDLLPVLDNFERALSAATSTSDVESLKTGISFILQQFQETLKTHGIEPIEAEGKAFDPKTHEAIEEVESDQKSGTVVSDVQRGYSFKGQVLRPSRVRVAK